MLHVITMCTLDCFSRLSPDGKTFVDRTVAKGYPFDKVMHAFQMLGPNEPKVHVYNVIHTTCIHAFPLR